MLTTKRLQGVVEVVLAVLSKEDSSDSLLEQACRALACMTADDNNKKTAGRCKGVEAVMHC